jgi:hypothetical protein
MRISVVNHSNGRVTDEDLQTVIRSINRQIREDFAPFWHKSGALRLEGRSSENPDVVKNADMRGDAVIYLWDRMDVSAAVGEHRQNSQGVPYGFVFTELAQAIGEPWSVSLSHEALELLVDPETNLLVMGPHPEEEREVFHWLEVCDAVQAETYTLDGVLVSNFVLPLYFTGTRDTDEQGARNDFLGRSYGGLTLRSFKINPGGYIGFFDPESASHETYSIKDDPVAQSRLDAKSRAKQARRSTRYRTFPEGRQFLPKSAAGGADRLNRVYVPIPGAIPAPAAAETAETAEVAVEGASSPGTRRRRPGKSRRRKAKTD